jgi:hypothetical protein
MRDVRRRTNDQELTKLKREEKAGVERYGREE